MGSDTAEQGPLTSPRSLVSSCPRQRDSGKSRLQRGIREKFPNASILPQEISVVVLMYSLALLLDAHPHPVLHNQESRAKPNRGTPLSKQDLDDEGRDFLKAATESTMLSMRVVDQRQCRTWWVAASK